MTVLTYSRLGVFHEVMSFYQSQLESSPRRPRASPGTPVRQTSADGNAEVLYLDFRNKVLKTFRYASP